MLKFSANLSLLFTELPWEQRFQAAVRAGFDAVEIQFPYEMPAQRIAHCLDEAGIPLVLFNVPAGDLMTGGEGLAAVPERREAFHAAVEQAQDYARLLQPCCINVLPGRCLDPARRGEYLATLTDNLRYAAEAFAGLGVTTVFEAINRYDMPGFLLDNGAGMLALLDRASRPSLAMQYDVYHMARMGEDYHAFIAEHADRIGHIQFADCPGRGQPGSGAIDFRRLFAGIAASGYRGCLGAEYRPQGDTETSLAWLHWGRGAA